MKVVKDWRRIPTVLKYTFNEEENIFNVKFSVLAPEPTQHMFIAYSFPYSFTEMTEKLDELE